MHNAALIEREGDFTIFVKKLITIIDLAFLLSIQFLLSACIYPLHIVGGAIMGQSAGMLPQLLDKDSSIPIDMEQATWIGQSSFHQYKARKLPAKFDQYLTKLSLIEKHFVHRSSAYHGFFHVDLISAFYTTQVGRNHGKHNHDG